MDLLSEIQNKADNLGGHPSQVGIKAAIKHVEIAERWFIRGRSEQDENMFNDVIYRTNQAFEGMLKEAYKILTNDNNTLSTYQIEQHLLQRNIFTPRVLELFKNYRQEWRNPSTHEHSLFFNEHEALLAIVRVSAFTAILLDQIIEKVIFHREKEKISRNIDILSLDNFYKVDYSLTEIILKTLEYFAMGFMQQDMNIDITSLREVEILGVLSAYFESLIPSVTIQREPILAKDTHLRPDFILQRGDERVLLEVKHPGFRNIDQGKSQVKKYLSASNINQGILYIPPNNKNQKMTTAIDEFYIEKRKVLMFIVSP